MVTLKEIEDVIKKCREKGLKIVIKFKKSRYGIVINREIKAIDEYGKPMSWAKAFPIPPNQVIDSYGITLIEIYCNENKIYECKSWKELIQNIEKIYCY